MTESEIEAAIHRCGPGRVALIEAAFQEDALWRNMARLCGLTAAETMRALPYILRTYEPDGRRRGDVRAAAGSHG